MEPTNPKPPMPVKDVIKVVDAVGATEMVLVGGQAVGMWAYHYVRANRLQELSDENEMFVSKDVDALAHIDTFVAQAEDLAKLLGGTLRDEPRGPPRLDAQELGPPPSDVTVVEYTSEDGSVWEVDVLVKVHGVTSERVFKGAAHLEGPTGQTVYCLDPVSLVESRLANCVDLEKYRTTRGFRQAAVAILVLREFLRDLAAKDPRVGRRTVAAVEDLCRSERGLRAFHDYALDPWAAVEPSVRALGEDFATEDYPRRNKRVVNARLTWEARRT